MIDFTTDPKIWKQKVFGTFAPEERIVVVTASREAAGPEAERRIREILDQQHHPDYLYHGDAAGGDQIAKAWAEKNSKPVAFPVTDADWVAQGRSAGPRRNRRMLTKAIRQVRRPNVKLCAFPVRGAGNKGTNGTIRMAEEMGIEVLVTELEPFEVQWVQESWHRALINRVAINRPQSKDFIRVVFDEPGQGPEVQS